MLDMSKSTLALIENGYNRPSLERAEHIAHALASRVEDLFVFQPCTCGCGEPTFGRFVSGHNSRLTEHRDHLVRGRRARRARLGIPEEKHCKKCGEVFTRSDVPRTSLAHWLAREHCSFECYRPAVDSRQCAICGTPFKPSYSVDSSRRCCCGSHGQQFRFEAGNVAPGFVAQMPGKARSVWGGRWAATKPPSPGAPPRGRPAVGVTAEQESEIRRLRAQGWGRRAIASRLLVSEWAVRNVPSS